LQKTNSSTPIFVIPEKENPRIEVQSSIKTEIIKGTPRSDEIKKSKLPTSTPSNHSDIFDPLSSISFVSSTFSRELIVVDDEIVVSSPIKSSPIPNNFRYERDFLLNFQKYCKEPLEGLIEEVLPGYIPPYNPLADLTINTNIKTYNKSPFRKIPSSPMESKTSSNPLITACGSVLFKPFKTTSSELSPLKISLPVSSSERVPELSMESKSSPSTPTALRTQPSTPSSPLSATTVALEWRVKKIRKPKPRETDPRRLAARQKQIDIGLNTVGYKCFLEMVPVEKRTREHPRIPDTNQVCSKRSWDGQVRKWRRQLHDYDPISAGESKHNDILGEEVEIISAEDALSDEEDSFEDDQQEVEASA